MEPTQIWTLYRNTPGSDTEQLADMLFAKPYDAWNFLRELSYSFQLAGAKTEVPGQMDEPKLKVFFNKIPVTEFTLVLQG